MSIVLALLLLYIVAWSDAHLIIGAHEEKELGSIRPHDLRVEYRLADPSLTLDPPLGLDMPNPRFVSHNVIMRYVGPLVDCCLWLVFHGS
jgi:hypothetical protein